MKKIIISIGIVCIMCNFFGCKKEQKSLETVELASSTDIEEYKDSSHVEFETVTDTLYQVKAKDVPEELSETIWTETKKYVDDYIKVLFNYHGETDLTERLLPYFGEQGKYMYHDYDFPELVAKEFARKNIELSYLDHFISGMYLLRYDSENKQYVVSFSGYVTTEMQTKTIDKGIYCNTICGTLLYDVDHWEMANFKLEYVRKSPCEVKCVDINQGTFQYLGEQIEIWDVDNADLETPELPQDNSPTGNYIEYNGDEAGIISE